jgi:hypothetical protein
MRNVVLAAMCVAALMVSPAAAQSARTPTPSNTTYPTDADGSVAPYVANEVGPHRPSLPGAHWSPGGAISGNPAQNRLIPLVVIRGGAFRPPVNPPSRCAVPAPAAHALGQRPGENLGRGVNDEIHLPCFHIEFDSSVPRGGHDNFPFLKGQRLPLPRRPS